MNQETPEKNASSALEFKRKKEARDKGTLLTLPSGLVARVKRPSVRNLIAAGFIPNQLAQVVLNLTGGKESDVKADDLPKIIELQKIVAKYSLVEPEIVDEPDYSQNQLSLEDIDDADLDEVWNFVNGRDEQIESFRDNGEGAPAGPDSPKVSRDETKRPGSGAGPVSGVAAGRGSSPEVQSDGEGRDNGYAGEHLSKPTWPDAGVEQQEIARPAQAGAPSEHGPQD